MEPTIKFMDLKRQYLHHKAAIAEAIAAVCEETAFSGGKFVDVFEKEFAAFCNVSGCSCVANGTEAIHLGLRALGVGEGDEVIVPANTFIASAWGASYVGARPVFVDCTSDTWEIDPAGIEQAMSKRTKVIIGVHLYGQPFDFDSVNTLASANHVTVIEDCAQSHGATYREKIVGGLGEMGCFSFYPGKNLGAYGEGGAIVSNNEFLLQRVQSLRNHGSKVKYYHDEIGYNFRMDGIQAAILSYKLKFLDEWTKRRQSIARRYALEIQNPQLVLQAQQKDTQSVFHLFVAATPDRGRMMQHLAALGIECGQHYPVPCHLQRSYAHFGYSRGDMPNAEWLADHCFSLPMFPELTENEVTRVIEACNSYGR